VKQPRRALHGVLVLDKPLGWTSNDALQKCKGLLRAEKGGHTGTLDPLATGLLPLCFGAATKFAQASLDADKAYRATLTLGITMSTGDLEGEVVEVRPVPALTAAQLQSTCDTLLGEIDQIPPMHSALKHEGRALYEYARQGLEVERPARRVRIERIQVVQGEGAEWVVDVRCSKGTYVRTLAESIGQALGCGAHLKALRRTASGPLEVDRAWRIEQIETMSEAERVACLQPADVLLADWPQIRLPAEEAGRFLTGLRRRVTHEDTEAIRVYGPEPGALLGIAHIQSGELIATRLLSPDEVRSQIERTTT
jgi:tRNA pseudouridine55 synthase